MLPRWCLRWRSLPRRLCAGITLLAYLTAALGLPLPVSAARSKKGGVPFPCQDNPCGCQSAEECWRGCCCFTAEERWAWARAHGITPPPYAEKPAPKPRRTTRSHHNCKHKSNCSCCSTKHPSRRPAAPRRSCRNSPNQSGGCPHCTHHSEPCCQHVHPTGPTWLLGIAAQKCRGENVLWASTGIVLPLPPPSWTPHLLPAGWLPLISSSAMTLPVTPPDPPPRLGLVVHSV
jgi:hypothetical protein